MLTFTGFSLVAVLTFVVAVLLPLLVGIVTNKVTSPARKAVLLIVLSFVASILSELVDALTAHVAYDVGSGLLKFGAIAVVAIASYFGVWSRPTSTGTSVSSHLVNNVGNTVSKR